MDWKVCSVTLKNFRSLKDVSFDLTEGSAGVPRDFALVVGENGSGKTNLMDSIAFLKMSQETALLSLASGEDFEGGQGRSGRLCVESGRTFEFRVPFHMPDVPVWDIRSLADIFRTFGSVNGPEMEMSFKGEGFLGRYILKLGDDGRVCEESLDYRINSRSGNIFTIKTENGAQDSMFSQSLFPDARARNRFVSEIENEWGRHSFLSLVKRDAIMYGEDGLGTGLMDVIGFIDDLIVLSPEVCRIASDGMDDVWRNIFRGTVSKGDEWMLKRTETFLRYYLRDMVTDVKGIRYDVEEREGFLDYEQKLKRMIQGDVIEIPAELESEGVRKLVSLAPAFYYCSIGRSVFIDDFDTHLHVNLMASLSLGIKRAGRGQFVATTHCTRLLETEDPENCYVIQTDVDAYKRILSFPKIVRTMTNHNNRLRYESGVFAGIPVTAHIDMGSYTQFADEDGKVR